MEEFVLGVKMTIVYYRLRNIKTGIKQKKTYDKENIINNNDNTGIAFRIRSEYVLCRED